MSTIKANSAVTPPFRPPVISESFTHLACNQSSTMGLEGCAEARLLSADRRVNKEVHLLFDLIPTKGQERKFVTAESLWLVSRTADCQSVSSVYQGGTVAPVEYGLCEVSEDQARSVMLHSYFELLVQGAITKPAWP
ncbi:MAG TPA: lysozyme inhibitor LprI family protein [Acidimicrobiales bacterium]|nr:lysozyme inhibitor LprI family protein [Acidimicrobiales bacterium]